MPGSEVEKDSNRMDATAEMLDRRCSAPGIRFESTEAEEAYRKRAKRIAEVLFAGRLLCILSPSSQF
jgi:hypothetical protein